MYVSIRGKTFMFASKYVLTCAKHFEIRSKTFTVQGKTAKVLSLERFVIYGITNGLIANFQHNPAAAFGEQ